MFLALAATTAQTVPAKPAPPTKTQPRPPISAEQARKLFASVDTILRFDSLDTGLAIHHDVKRKLISRQQVLAFLKQRMDQDKDTARVERSAIVLEKFGLLPEQFQLRDFLLKLLGEQVAGFYDSKTKTVNLLDWVDADTQKPVLAHELTHALQDQFQTVRGVDLDKWENAGPEGTAQTVAEDRAHIRYDETDTAREAALEGQAMVTYLDWSLAGQSRSLRTLPDIDPATLAQAAVGKDADSPVLAAAPLVLRESLLFPYDEGLVFEQKILKTHGAQAAFGGVLQRPPNTSYEILHPGFYESGGVPPLLAMPDLHPLLKQDWRPYDVGVMGALDVRMLCEQLADVGAGADAALDWDGGLYYAAQSHSATTEAEKASTASIALIYLSRWKSVKAATSFANLYRNSLKTRYPGLQSTEASPLRTVDQTSEGPVLVSQSGRYVFISHTLAVPVADQVMALMLATQTGGAPQTASTQPASLTAPLRSFFPAQGTLRATLPRVY